MSETDKGWEEFRSRYFCPNDGTALVEDEDPNYGPTVQVWSCPKCGFSQGFAKAFLVPESVS